ncbi:hypothetical protein S7335_483 [Synechococcus sp. PCC 7335]|uniref:hypothetical protein n=1 Tax=Synechococcus sp. (strain ATCC 29403 / PCC 7335) TaxID=91464 RepID=UPI00017ED2C5|nr:hypothetical protein [Synechococcus sp. PCC 7335]EDX83303.1 hypothetical protein S7335_483 [Synechococcus sp. PCC 7335]
MNIKKWWGISNSISLLFLILIGGMWVYATHSYSPNQDQLTKKTEVDAYLSEFLSDRENDEVPTGVFIQSLKFNNSTEVNFTGYIWQTYDRAYTAKYKNPEDIPVGFVLPEAVESESNGAPKFAYRKVKGNKEVIGWYFEATLKQKFEYSKYPFDHKNVWVRLWSNDFKPNKVLVPDFDGYESTDLEKAFGYDTDIVLGDWQLLETFFDYKEKSYNSNFGIFEDDELNAHPELYFNVVLKRRFLNSFVVYILPLAIIACLIFATLMMITKDPNKESSLGMNTSGVIGVCSGLFFIVLLSQVQIREQFAGSDIVYIEYLYPLMYLSLLGVSVNSYLFALPDNGNNRLLYWIHKDDNVHPRLIFWPLLLGSATVITACALLPEESGQDQSRQGQTFGGEKIQVAEMVEVSDVFDILRTEKLEG